MEYTIKKVLIRSEDQSFFSPQKILPLITWISPFLTIYRLGTDHSSLQVEYFIPYFFFVFLKIILSASFYPKVLEEGPMTLPSCVA